ncbi:MAG: DUF2018 family protein [Sulfurimonas sp.]
MNKYSALFEDEDDIFSGSPKSKLMDVIFNANNDIVIQELANFITKSATMELLLEKHVGEDIDAAVKNYDAHNMGESDEKAKSLYIELMGSILSQSE